MTEQSEPSSNLPPGKKFRGRNKATIKLIDEMYGIAEETRPVTGRGIGYKLFAGGLISGMNRMNVVYRALKLAREDDTIPWDWIVDETRELELVSTWTNLQHCADGFFYRRNLWQTQPKRVEVWSEKGTVRGVLWPVLAKLGVGFQVMHGFSSATCVWNACQNGNDDRPLVALYITELADHSDVSDWLAGGGTKEALLARAKAAPQAIPPLEFINLAGWKTKKAPPREWAVQDRIPLRAATLFSGEGGAGKSNLQLQLCAAHTLSAEWLHAHPAPGPSMFIDVEDDENEIHRRVEAILEHYGASYDDAIRGGLHIKSLADEDPVMATVAKNGKVETTPLYDQVYEAAGDIKPKMVGIASAANIFAGNENDRAQVQQFISCLCGLPWLQMAPCN